MDRFVNMDARDFQPGVVYVTLKFTAGTSGAVPSPFAATDVVDGIASVTKSTNDYLVVFQDSYADYLGFYGDVKQASFSTSGACQLNVSADAVTTAGGGTLTVSPRNGAGAAVALATGDVINCTFRLQRRKN